MSWADHFLAFDVETSGFHKEARVLELAIVEFVCGEPAQAETFLFSPPGLDWEDERTKKALEVNGLDPDELRQSPPFEFRFPRVQECLAWAPIWVAHNTAFDIRMLDREFSRLNLATPRPRDLLACTLSLERHLRQASRTASGFKLAEVASARGVQIGAMLHRAHVDATLAGRIFIEQARELPETLEDVQRVAGAAWAQQTLLR